MLSNYITDEILIKWCGEAGMNFRKVTYKIKPDVHKNEPDILYIYTSRPGLLIGSKGCLVEKYKIEFSKEAQKFVEIEFIEVTEIMTEDEWDDFVRGRGF